MADFLTRLSERALASVALPTPVVAPLFAAGPSLATHAEGLSEGEPEASVVAASGPSRPATTLVEQAAPAPRHAEAAPPAGRADQSAVAEPARGPIAAPPPRPSSESPAPGPPVPALLAAEPPGPPQPPAQTHVLERVEAREVHETRVVEPTVVRVAARDQRPEPRVEPRATRREPSPARQVDAEPRVEVTIGRVEVRLSPPAAPPPARRATAPANPRLSLEAYLQSRDGTRA